MIARSIGGDDFQPTLRIADFADGGPFVSQADKNPTWTILALAWRTSDEIIRMRKAGTV